VGSFLNLLKGNKLNKEDELQSEAE
jgi:hypothetical protein